ncbi:MAG: sensor histidine kinase [Eubacteriales bacterium]|nr:sensor histidine kinase [Eubacteriales bacterium]
MHQPKKTEVLSPDSGVYLNVCLKIIGILNFITVMFLAGAIVLTQYRIAFSQEAAEFVTKLVRLPERPEIRLVMVAGCYMLICLSIWVKRQKEVQGTPLFTALNVIEIGLVILLMEKIDMSYNGIIFFVFAEFLYYVKESRNRLVLLILAFLCYMGGSYQLVTLLVPMNSFETWVSFYTDDVGRLFLSMRTVCELCNMILFLSYMVLLLVADRKENERIRSLNQQLQKANEQLHSFAQEKEQMGETRERNRLAREIHDTLGHILTGISVGVEAAAVLVEVSPEAAKQQLDVIADMARKGLNDVRRSVRKLKPDALERLSFEHAIQQMVEEMSRGTNTKIYFVSYTDGMEFGADIEETLYRSIQESTTNAIRHGKATEIWVRMSEKNGELILMISDNGRGCDKVEEGFGLRHMRERVELAGGTLYWEGTFGFTVIVRLPVRTKKKEERKQEDDKGNDSR